MIPALATVTGQAFANHGSGEFAPGLGGARVSFTPVQLDQTAAVVDALSPVELRTDAQGMIPPTGLWPGEWSFRNHRDLSEFTFVVTAGGTYDLHELRGYVPGPGVSVTLVPLGAVTPADIGAATAAQGAKADASDVHQITLTGPLVLTIPEGHPAGQVYRCAITQTTGGHTVTYGGAPVSVDTTAGASTLVEFWPGGTLVYPGAAAAATRGLIITDTDVASIPAGTPVDNLSAYYNAGTAPITVAGVELAPGSHAVWAWVAGAWVQLSGGTSTPVDTSDTTAPVWAATLTTGTATDTSVVISASALATDDSGEVGYRWRLTGESTAIARTVTPSGLNFTLTGLTPNTAYAAPILWAVDAGGNKSDELTAQGFTTDTAPKQWTRVFYDTFTAPDGTLLSAHTPDMGGAWTMGRRPDDQVILGGAVQAVMPAGYSGSATPDVTASKTFANPTRDIRVRANIDMRSGRHQLSLRPANQNYALELSLRADLTALDLWGGSGQVVETTGLTAHMGTGVHDVEFTVVGDIATLRVDGAKLREWTITWGTWGTYIGTLSVMWGAAGWYEGGSLAEPSNRTSSVEVEVWQ